MIELKQLLEAIRASTRVQTVCAPCEGALCLDPDEWVTRHIKYVDPELLIQHLTPPAQEEEILWPSPSLSSD